MFIKTNIMESNIKIDLDDETCLIFFCQKIPYFGIVVPNNIPIFIPPANVFYTRQVNYHDGKYTTLYIYLHKYIFNVANYIYAHKYDLIFFGTQKSKFPPRFISKTTSNVTFIKYGFDKDAMIFEEYAYNQYRMNNSARCSLIYNIFDYIFHALLSNLKLPQVVNTSECGVCFDKQPLFSMCQNSKMCIACVSCWLNKSITTCPFCRGLIYYAEDIVKSNTCQKILEEKAFKILCIDSKVFGAIDNQIKYPDDGSRVDNFFKLLYNRFF